MCLLFCCSFFNKKRTTNEHKLEVIFYGWLFLNYFLKFEKLNSGRNLRCFVNCFLMETTRMLNKHKHRPVFLYATAIELFRSIHIFKKKKCKNCQTKRICQKQNNNKQFTLFKSNNFSNSTKPQQTKMWNREKFCNNQTTTEKKIRVIFICCCSRLM